MTKHITIMMIIVAALAVTGCGKASAELSEPNEGVEVIGEETPVMAEEPAAEGEKGKRLTDDQAVSAIRDHCRLENPELEGIEEDGYQVSWSVESSNEKEIVVLFRSYTGAEVRYHIDPVSGETYVTEFVQGITPEEETTGESFNVWDEIE